VRPNISRNGSKRYEHQASSGIGREFAGQLASAGINVVLIARRLAALRDIGTELSARYGIAYRTVGVDLSEPGLLAPVAKAIADLDVGLLVSNPAQPTPERSWTPTWMRSDASSG
jgi:uncharacterized protein